MGDPREAALALLERCKSIERALGRRPRGRWGPREIDLDILVFGRHRLDLPPRPSAAEGAGPLRGAPGREGSWLVVPHPEARRRLFVLAPLADLAPGLVPPGWRETVATARRRLEAEVEEGAVSRVGLWAGSGWVADRPASAEEPHVHQELAAAGAEQVADGPASVEEPHGGGRVG